MPGFEGGCAALIHPTFQRLNANLPASAPPPSSFFASAFKRDYRIARSRLNNVAIIVIGSDAVA